MLKKCLLAAVVATALFQSPAHAGFQATWPLQIEPHPDGTIAFWGSLGSVRNSADWSEEIGCNVLYQLGQWPVGYCYAVQDSPQGKVDVSCHTSDPWMLVAIQSIGTDSMLHITIDAEGRCSRIRVQNLSWVPPKAL